MKNPEETPFYNKTHRQTDTGGNVEQRLSYDAWGGLRDPATWSGSFTGTPLFDRGFTGHEHLINFGLINMNGRMYDPVMSSFLSVDRFLQDPTSAQGFNRYAYCGHNPLRYVDPSGWEMVKPVPGRTPSSADYAMDPYAYAERAYEPRDLGLLQLPTNDPTVVWMEENEMHGVAGGEEAGGFYLNLASGLIEYHEGQCDFLKQGLVFLADDNASVEDIENNIKQRGLRYKKDPRVLGGYIVDTEEMFKGYLLWRSIPSISMIFAFGSVECLLNSVLLCFNGINSTAKSSKISYEFTETTLQRMDNPSRRVPLNIIDEVIKNPKVITPDPQGTNATMYYSTFYRNGKLYNIEVL